MKVRTLLVRGPGEDIAMHLKVGDRFELGTKERLKDGTIIAMSNKGNVALVEWDLGGSDLVAFDTIHWFDQVQDAPA
jgi:hypothetical protein